MKYTFYIICLLLLLLAGCEQKITDAFALSGILEISSQKMQFNPDKSIKTIQVKGVIEWDVDSTGMADWCHLLLVRNHEGKEYITVKVNDNVAINNRETAFSVFSGEQKQEVKVEQLGHLPQIIFSIDSLTIGKSRNLLKVDYVTNIDFDMAAGDSWFTATLGEYEGQKRFMVEVPANESGADRKGVIRFTEKGGEHQWEWSFLQLAVEAAYQPQGIETLEANHKLVPLSATATSEVKNKEIGRTYDGDKLTYFQSKFQEAGNPIVLEYRFDGKEPIHYINYIPYEGDATKSFQQVEIWVQEEGQDYRMDQMTLYNNTGEQIKILRQVAEKPVGIKFVVKTTYINNANKEKGHVAACSEMEFYSAGSKYENIFADKVYGRLYPEVSLDDILDMEDPCLGNIAYCLYQGTYDMNRIATVSSCRSLNSMNFVGNYGGLNNVTGIVVKAGEVVPVFADKIGADNVYLIVLNPSNPMEMKRYKLYDGINKLTMDYSGHLYVSYESPVVKTVEIHIAGGRNVGFYNSLTGQVPVEDSDEVFVDAVGRHAQLLFKKESLEGRDVDALMEKYDGIVRSQQIFMGLEKSGQDFDNRILFLQSDKDYQLEYIDNSNYIACPSIDMATLANPSKISGQVLWNIALQVGRINNIKALTWKGVSAATPELFALASQEAMGEELQIDKEDWYAKGFNSILIPEVLMDRLADNLDEFPEKIVPFWQLKIYAEDVLGMKDFYKDLLTEMRKERYVQVFSFTRVAARLLKMNSGEFFRKWGFFVRNYFPSRDPEVPQALQYLTPANVDIFKHPGVPSADGFRASTTGSVTIYNPKNAVAFMVRHTFVPAQIFITPSFKVKDWKESMKIYAIGTDGTEVEIKRL